MSDIDKSYNTDTMQYSSSNRASNIKQFSLCTVLSCDTDIGHWTFIQMKKTKMPKNLFLTILAFKIRFWDHFLIVIISLLLLISGLRFSLRPLEIVFLAILHFIGQKMANYGQLWLEPHENGSKYSKPSSFVIVEVMKHFSL